MNPRLIGATVVLGVAVLIVFTIIYLVHRHQRQENIKAGLHRRGDLTKRQEDILLGENAEAFAILRRIRKSPSSIDGEIILIPDDLGEKIDRLIEHHEKNQRKVLAP